MVEIRRGSEGPAPDGPANRPAPGMGGGERLPWLEPVEDEDDGDYGAPPDPAGGGGFAGVMLAALGVLIAIAMVTAGIVWIRHHHAATADIGEVIHPEPGPYKVKPAVAGGLDTDATGQVAAGTSAGEDIDSVLDLNAVPERPVATRAKPGQAPAPQPGQPQQSLGQMPIPAAPAPQAKPATAAPVAPVAKAAPAVPAAKPAPTPKPAPAPAEKEEKVTGGGSTIQLGAFSTEAKAKSVWKSLTSRFHYLQEMTPVVLPVAAGDTKLFRLRATGGAEPAGQVCGKLRIAGETCAVVGP